MCTRYVSPEAATIERTWHVGRHNPWRGAGLFPRQQGAFIRAARDSTEPARELIIGQWGLIPWFATSAKLSYATHNARFEEIKTKASFKNSWQYGKRCVIPAVSFDEPNWQIGKNVWWRFRRADTSPWGLAGLWSTWIDKTTGEVFESYTMLTMNADTHPLMSRMHKPDPRLPPDRQDKRSVVPVEIENVDQWLFGTEAEAASLMGLADAGVFVAGPAADADPALPGV
jgi:putative SOS response-associated peptidase YedK